MAKFKSLKKEEIKKLPQKCGVYSFKNKKGAVLYIGKATNIKERVKNHFPSRSEGERRTNVLRTLQPAYRDGFFIDQVKKIGYIETDSEIEALILEANLIKKHQPKYNVVWRDDKNYFFVAITKEYFPRIFWTHQPKQNAKYIGPFVDGKALKQTLKILRKVFPYRSCKTLPKRPCLWYQLGRCPAPCLLKTSTYRDPVSVGFGKKLKKEYTNNTKSLIRILQGKKKRVLIDLKREMKKASSCQDFEKAAKIRDQMRSLEKVLAHARIFEPQPFQAIEWTQIQKTLQKILKTRHRISRIEAYDISNIQGQEATGSMITFIKGLPDKNFYRKFKIKNRASAGSEGEDENKVLIALQGTPNDIAMLKEVLKRRFKHPEWPYPDLILIDGGKAQLNAALKIKNLKSKIKNIKVMALAKKRNELFVENLKKQTLLKNLPREIFNLILQLRDEAHRFARKYHHKLREKTLLSEN